MPKGIFKRKPLTDEHKRKLSIALMGNKNMIGVKLSEDHKRKIGLKTALRIGEKANNWKGDSIGYNGLHQWVRKVLGKPSKCEYCLTEGLFERKIGWANISHKYKREASDWIRLCRQCHSDYDRGLLILNMEATK